MINPDALTPADDLDRRFRQSGPVGPMHCVPVIVKDNYETIDMPTTAGSLSLKGMMTGKDAFVVKRLRDAGAVMIAKSNMAEFAFSPVETVNSILPGYTRNPYDTSRVTAGSSGGSAAAAAANFGAVALASDTGDSIRGPAAHQALVGLRSTMGLVSRAGVVPLNLGADIAGAVTRTVADTAAVLQVIAGEDPDDPATAASRGTGRSRTTRRRCGADGLKGARLGVLHQAYDTPTLDPEVDARVSRRARRAREAWAPRSSIRSRSTGSTSCAGRRAGGCNQFKYDLNRYLAGLGDKAPMHSLDEIIKSRRFHPSIQARLEGGQASDDVPGETPGCRSRDEFREKLRAAVLKLMDDRPARRADLPDVEQSAAAHRRSEHAGRRQQPVLRAEHRLPGDHRADGLYTRRHAARRAAVLRPGVERGDAHPPGLRVRAGDASPASAAVLASRLVPSGVGRCYSVRRRLGPWSGHRNCRPVTKYE